MAINCIFVSQDVETTRKCWRPPNNDSRNVQRHQQLDTTRGLLCIVRPSAQRLTTKQPRMLAAYTSCLKHHYRIHCIPERLDGLLCRVTGTEENISADTEFAHAIQTIYSEMDQYRINAESCCRNITKPTLPYSPSSSFWYDQVHTYRVLL